MTDVWLRRYDTPPELGAHERFDYWRGWHSAALDTPMRLDPIARTPDDFRSSAESLTVADVSLIRLDCGPSVGLWRREGMEASDQLRVAVFRRARSVDAFWHGRGERVTGGTAVLFGRTAGRWRAPYGFETIQVNMPRSSVPVPDRELERITCRGLPQDSPVLDALIRPALLSSIGQFDRLYGARTAELSGVWRAMVTMLMRSLAEQPLDGADLAPARRVRIRTFISAHLADPDLTPDSIAASFHMSRRSLYHLMADDGEGVAAAIRRQRLSRAREILLDPACASRPIAEIGAAVGLPNAAHFSRLFRAEHGASPRELRQQLIDDSCRESATA